MNDHEAARIAAAMNQMRPDWPVKQLATLLRDERIAGRPRRDVAVALAWVACEANSASPYRVLETGPWWRAVAVEGTASQGKRGPICLHCGFERADCERRWSHEHQFEGPDDWMRRSLPPEKVAERIQYARSGIGDAKAKREPEPEREPLPSDPRVDELRAIAAASLAEAIACEHVTDTTPCGQPAPHLSADRRRPLCGEHVESETTEVAW